ncbi:MAG: HAMP domain-containing histidine kinase [Brachyspira sp.]|nr:HAMP domain-containing histidine kinase [Brachyspira sp.]
MSDNEKNYEDFISTVSHELRTPLTSIRGFSQTMLSSWDKLDDESKKKFLKIIEEQSNRLINLVENMLSVTKLQSSKDMLILKETDILPVVNTVVSIVKNQYKNRSFEVVINPKTPTVLVDRDKFMQVMTNLVENAAKYSDENSTIKIKSGFCQNCEFVSIKVIDNGVGISENDYQKIFTKFSRIDNPLTRKVQGSGLGLYITKNLVEKMNGEISVHSKDGETTFEVRLPVCNLETLAREKCKQ